MQFQLPLIGIAAILATPAAAQQTSPGSIPIYDITPPVLPTPTPTPTPTAVPTARATPAPRATPTPRATPVTPRVIPTPTVRATPTAIPTPRAAPVSGPDEAAPMTSPTATPTPEMQPTPETLPVVEPSPVIVATGSASATGGDALPWWAWFLGGIVVASLAAFAIGRFRRGQVREVYEDAPVATMPAAPIPAAPAPVVPPVVPPAPRAVPPVRPTPPAPVPPAAPVEPVGPFLEFQLAPLRVGMQGDNALLDFDLTIGNPASMPVAEVGIATLLLTANAGQDEQIAAFFANDARRGLEPFALGAGERRHLEATMTLPRVAVNVVTANERSFFVPLIAIDARYRWEDGRESRTCAAFLVGPSAPKGKLSPIFTDRGDRMAERLEVRLHGPIRRT